jgi:hypothetical protein
MTAKLTGPIGRNRIFLAKEFRSSHFGTFH